MSHYVDTDKAKELWSGEHPIQIAMRKIFEDLPAADVVPRSGVDELKAIIANHKASEERLEKLYSNAKSEVKRLQSEVTTLLNDLAVATLKYENAEAEAVRKIFEEIKNLYMEEHDGCAVHMSRYEFAELEKKYLEPAA